MDKELGKLKELRIVDSNGQLSFIKAVEHELFQVGDWISLPVDEKREWTIKKEFSGAHEDQKITNEGIKNWMARYTGKIVSRYHNNQLVFVGEPSEFKVRFEGKTGLAFASSEIDRMLWILLGRTNKGISDVRNISIIDLEEILPAGLKYCKEGEEFLDYVISSRWDAPCVYMRYGLMKQYETAVIPYDLHVYPEYHSPIRVRPMFFIHDYLDYGIVIDDKHDGKSKETAYELKKLQTCTYI